MRISPLFAIAAMLPAQGLVRDIRPTQLLNVSSNPQQVTFAANRVWFQATDAAHGTELWRTDGTPAGTQLYADLAPGTASSSPGLLTAFAGGLAFGSSNGLCWTDGISGNVVNLGVHIADLASAGRPLAIGPTLFFVATLRPEGQELWSTDGTPAGTGLVADIVPGLGSSFPHALCELNGLLYFAANNGSGARLWRSDGTAAGTYEVAPAAAYGSCEEVVVAGGRVFFGSYSTHELWQSDGTAAGTTLVLSGFATGPGSLTGGGSKLVFAAGNAATGFEPWVSDGTPAGTQLLADTNPGAAAGLFAGQFYRFGTYVLFGADDGVHGQEPWVSDLTPAGTMPLGDLYPGAAWSTPAYAVAFGNGIYFNATTGNGAELWFTDGTPAGTRLVRDIAPSGSADPAGFATVGALTVFSADDGVHGREPWITDGTSAGTQLLRDIAAVPQGSDPFQFRTIGKRTVFVADDGVHGTEPWVTDGTAAGTMLLVDTVPGAANGGYSPLGSWHGALWFTVHGHDLWRTDGSPAGTVMVVDLAATLPNILWFAGLDDRAIVGGENRFCVTDGTAVGTTLLPFTSQTQMLWGIRFGDYVYFAAADSAHGRELWRTDGTAAGTVMFYEFTPGPGNSLVTAQRIDGDLLYLSASSQQSTVFPFGPLDIEPWVTDGTVAGTQRLGDLSPGVASSLPAGFVPFAGSVWFVAESPSGVGLYRTDGTPAGTVRFFGLTLRPDNLAAAGSLLFFQNAGEVWSTDGTLAGTFQSLDIAPGPADSQTRDFVALGASTELAFTAVVPGQPRTLWLTDGTAAGTRQEPGLVLDALTTTLARNGTDVLFPADDGVLGRELYSLRLRSEHAAMADLLGDGCRGTLGAPRMQAGAAPRLGSTFAIKLDHAQPNAPALAVHAFALLPGGDRAGCSAALDVTTGVALFLPTDGAGHAATSVALPNAPFALGIEIYSQWAVVDPAGGLLGAFALSPVLDWMVGA
jgi:trimeric autotransporter adhesin